MIPWLGSAEAAEPIAIAVAEDRVAIAVSGRVQVHALDDGRALAVWPGRVERLAWVGDRLVGMGEDALVWDDTGLVRVAWGVGGNLTPRPDGLLVLTDGGGPSWFDPLDGSHAGDPKQQMLPLGVAQASRCWTAPAGDRLVCGGDRVARCEATLRDLEGAVLAALPGCEVAGVTEEEALLVTEEGGLHRVGFDGVSRGVVPGVVRGDGQVAALGPSAVAVGDRRGVRIYGLDGAPGPELALNAREPQLQVPDGPLALVRGAHLTAIVSVADGRVLVRKPGHNAVNDVSPATDAPRLRSEKDGYAYVSGSERLWTIRTSGRPVQANDEIAVFSGPDGVEAYDVATGKRRWVVPGLAADGNALGGSVVAATARDVTVALDAATGRRLREIPGRPAAADAGWVVTVATDRPATRFTRAEDGASVTLDGRWTPLGAVEGGFAALDESGGVVAVVGPDGVLWRRHVPRLGSGAVIDGWLVAMVAEHLVALDPATGAALWIADIGGVARQVTDARGRP